MISLSFDAIEFNKEMKNLIDYSVGFLEGIPAGKKELFNNLGPSIAEYASEFIDSNARVDPQTLHHIYEWYHVGDVDNRLFQITYHVTNTGLSFNSNFSQSKSIKMGSTVPFYDKAQIMEQGSSVTINPVKSDVLRFEVGNEVVYTRKPVIVLNPGGNTKGQFAQVFDTFFSKYFTQAFMRSSGLNKYFNNPTVYKENLKAGLSTGKSKGYSTGYNWVANAGKSI